MITIPQMLRTLAEYDYVISSGDRDEIIKEMSKKYTDKYIKLFLYMIRQLNPADIPKLIEHYKEDNKN